MALESKPAPQFGRKVTLLGIYPDGTNHLLKSQQTITLGNDGVEGMHLHPLGVIVTSRDHGEILVGSAAIRYARLAKD